jgi:magnesium-transporting ATPase (P-type)
VETAISIAHSCRLFTEGMPVIELREAEFSGCDELAERTEVCAVCVHRRSTHST